MGARLVVDTGEGVPVGENGIAEFYVSGEDEKRVLNLRVSLGGRDVTAPGGSASLSIVFTAVEVVANPSEMWMEVGQKATVSLEARWTHNGESVEGVVVRSESLGKEFELPAELELESDSPGVLKLDLELVEAPYGIGKLVYEEARAIWTGLLIKARTGKTWVAVGEEVELELEVLWMHNGERAGDVELEFEGLAPMKLSGGHGVLTVKRDSACTLELKVVKAMDLEHGISLWEYEGPEAIVWTRVLLKAEAERERVRLGKTLGVVVRAVWEHDGSPVKRGTIVCSDGSESELTDGVARFELKGKRRGRASYEFRVGSTDRGVTACKRATVEVLWLGFEIRTASTKYYFKNGERGRIVLRVLEEGSGKPADGCILYCKELGVKVECRNGRAVLELSGKDEKKPLTLVVLAGGMEASGVRKITVVFTDLSLAVEPLTRCRTYGGEYWIERGETLRLRVRAFLTVDGSELRGVLVEVNGDTYSLPATIELSPPVGRHRYAIAVVEDPLGLFEGVGRAVGVVSTYIKLVPEKSTYVLAEGPVEVDIKAVWAHDNSPVAGVTIECAETGERVIAGEEGIVEFSLTEEGEYEFRVVGCGPRGICEYEPCRVKLLAKYLLISAPRLVYTMPNETVRVPVELTWINGTPAHGILVMLEDRPEVSALAEKGHALLSWIERYPGSYEYRVVAEVPCEPAEVVVYCTGVHLNLSKLEFAERGEELLAEVRVEWAHNGSPIEGALVEATPLGLSTFSREGGRAILRMDYADLHGVGELAIRGEVGVGSWRIRSLNEVLLDIHERRVEIERAVCEGETVLAELRWILGGRLLLANGSLLEFDERGICALSVRAEEGRVALYAERGYAVVGESVYILPEDQTALLHDRLELAITIEGLYARGGKVFLTLRVRSLAEVVTMRGVVLDIVVGQYSLNRTIEEIGPGEEVVLEVELPGPVFGFVDVKVETSTRGGRTEAEKRFLALFVDPLLLALVPLPVLALIAFIWKRKSGGKKPRASIPHRV